VPYDTSIIVADFSKDFHNNVSSGISDTVDIDSTGFVSITGHPRIVFTDSDLQNTIQPYIASYDSAKFEEWIDVVDAEYSSTISSKSRKNLLGDAQNFAFCAAAVNSGYFSNFSNFSYTAANYADKAYAHFQEIDSRNMYPHGNKDEIGITNRSEAWVAPMTMGLIYDWCYFNLSTAEKQNIADEIWDAAVVDEIQDAPKDRYMHQRPGVSFLIWAMPVMAFKGDGLGGAYDSYVNTSQNKINEFKTRGLGFLDQIYESKWGFPGGISYTYESAITLAWFFTCYRSSVSSSILTDYNFVSSIPQYHYYWIEPYKINDTYFQEKKEVGALFWLDNNQSAGAGMKSFMYLFQHFAGLFKTEFPDTAGFCRWVLNTSHYANGVSFSFDDFENEGARSTWLWYKFLHGSKDVTEKANAYPKSERLGQGRTWMYSELNSGNATKIYFETPEYTYVDLEQQDNGGVLLYKNGTVFLDSGHPKKAGGLNQVSGYAREPIAHNTIGFYEFSIVPSNELYEYRNSLNNNSDPNASANQEGGNNNVGEVISKDLEGTNYDWIHYDWSETYKNDDNGDSIRRAILYIRDPDVPAYQDDEYLVVHSYAQNRVQSIARELWHTAEIPEAVNGSFTQVSGAEYSTTDSVIKITNDLMFGNQTAAARVFMKVLRPLSANRTIRMWNGGSNGPWYPDAKGNESTDPSGSNDYNVKNQYLAGAYRLEIEETDGNTTNEWLTVFQICANTSYNSMSSVDELSISDPYRAVLIDAEANNGARLAVINWKVPLQSSGNVAVTGTSGQFRIFVTGLQNGVYTLTGGNNVTVSNNVLYATRNGNQTYTWTKQ
jgi:hypothetical protein